MENEKYLTNQIITYIGNKRKLLDYISCEVELILKDMRCEKAIICDLFSGSGIVARNLKQYASKLYANDLEKYSCIINECYLSNKEDFNEIEYNNYYNFITSQPLIEGIIATNYAPKNDTNIQQNERVFYTHENAMKIDTYRKYIDSIPKEYQKYFIAPLLYEASVHTNTSGVFKGFYKSKITKLGKFGGDNEDAIERIKGDINLKKPIFSNYSIPYQVFNENANELILTLKGLDITYLDPPYNQHPYGSNYFMLNTIVNNKLGDDISKISGIPTDWNKSAYNQKNESLKSFEELIKNIDSKYLIISYNNEGFISLKEMQEMLSKYGTLQTKSINYIAFRGSRNLKDRNIDVIEYLFILQKGVFNNTDIYKVVPEQMSKFKTIDLNFTED